MIVRNADKFDLHYFLHLVHKIHKSGAMGTYDVELKNDYLNGLFNSILHGLGVALVIEGDERVGMIVGIISPNVWSPETLILHQVLFYVDEEYRNTRAGHMLLTNYMKECKTLVKNKRIQYHTINASKPLFDIDFSRYGYDFTEKTWLSNGAE